MPKKPPKNGYFYFMVEFKRREEAAGRRFPGGMAEVADAASPEWKELPQAERDAFIDYAKEHRYDEDRPNVPKKPNENKFNSMGISLAVQQREREERRAKEIAIREFVSDFVRAKSIDGLKTDEMFLIHVNIFCKTDDELYYPAELAICKFSILQGVIATYHTFFDPGEIKRGYMFALKEQSERFHKITLSYVQQNPRFKDYSKIYDNIIQFLNFGKNRSVPLFTMYNDVFHNTNLTAVEKMFETLWSSKHSTGRDVDGWMNYFPVYPLPLMFTQLKNICYSRMNRSEIPFPDSSLATNELNNDPYYFTDTHSCDYHTKEEVFKHCSLSHVQRWAQIICNHCREVLGIKAEPIHFDIKVEPSEMDTAESAFSTESFNVKSECNDDDDGNQSMVSGVSYRTAMTNLTEENLGFQADSRPQTSSVSEIAQPAGVWGRGIGRGRGRGRGRAQSLVGVPMDDDENFPALGGIQRGVRNMRLAP